MEGNSKAHSIASNLNGSPMNQPQGKRYPAINTLLTILLVLIDVAMLVIAFAFAYHARLNLPLFPSPDPLGVPSLERYLPLLVLSIAITLVVFYLNQLYHQPRTVSRMDSFRNVIGMVTISALLASAIQDVIFRGTVLEIDYPRSLLFYFTLFASLLVNIGREGFRAIRLVLRHSKLDTDNLLVIGSGTVVFDLASRVAQNPSLGYNLLGVLTRDGHARVDFPSIKVIGDLEQVSTVMDTMTVDQVIIALPDSKRTELVELINQCQRGNVGVKVYPDILAYMSGDMNMDDLGGMPLITVRDVALRGWKLSLKRAMDIIGAGVGLTLLSPFMLITALWIRAESSGPTFYMQERMGLDGKRFQMIKFRSMRLDAESHGPGWTVQDDPRVTRIGRFIRRSNWDEIPQLINVLLGEMSLVGPRPERPVYVEKFAENFPRYMERHREKGGMTGWAQVNGLRGDTSIAERTALDLWYVENWSIWLDIKILTRTIWMTFQRNSKNAY